MALLTGVGSGIVTLIATGFSVPPPLPGWVTVRDRDILADIRLRLDATELFAAVVPGLVTQDSHEGDMNRPLALVAPASVLEADEWLDLTVRTLRATVAITVSGQEPGDLHSQLDRLGNLAANVLNRQNLAGVTLPGLTRVVGQRYLASQPPDQAIVLDLDCPYFVTPDLGRDTTE